MILLSFIRKEITVTQKNEIRKGGDGYAAKVKGMQNEGRPASSKMKHRTARNSPYNMFTIFPYWCIMALLAHNKQKEKKTVFNRGVAEVLAPLSGSCFSFGDRL